MKNQRKKHRVRRVLACLMLSCLIVDQVQSTMLYVRAEENSVQEKISDTESTMDSELQSGEAVGAMESEGGSEISEPDTEPEDSQEGENIKDIPEGENTGEETQHTTGTTESGETLQNNPEMTEPQEEIPQLLASGNLQLDKQNWDSNAKTFTLVLRISVPAGSTGNQINLSLPQYIKISANPAISETLTDIKVEGDSETGTMLTLMLADMVNQKEVELEVGISQEEFLEKAKPETDGQYKISAEYKNDMSGGIQARDELTFATSIYSKSYTARVDIGDDFNAIDFEKANNPAAYFEMTSLYAMDETSDWFYGDLYIPAETMRYLEWEGDKNCIQADGSVIFPYDAADDLDMDPHTLKLEVPIVLNKELAIQAQQFNSTWNGEVRPKGLKEKQIDISSRCVLPIIRYGTLKDGRWLKVTDEGYYSTLYASPGEDGSYILKDSREEEFTPIVYKEIGIRNSPEELSVLYKYALGESSLGTINYHFILPEGLIWDGSAEYYNMSTREVVMPLVEKTAAKGNYKMFQLKEDLKVRLENDMAVQDHLAGEKIFPIIKPYFEGNYLGVPFLTRDKDRVDASIVFSATDTGLKIEGKTISQGSIDAQLYQLNSSGLAQSDINEEFNLYGEWKEGTFSVNRIDFSDGWLSKVEGLQFFYTTNKNPERALVMTKGKHALPEGEYITSWRMNFKKGLKKNALVGSSIDFYGDVGTPVPESNIVKEKVSLRMETESGQTTKFITAASGEVIAVRKQKIPDAIKSVSDKLDYYPDMMGKSGFLCTLKFNNVNRGEEYYKNAPFDVEVELPDNVRIQKVSSTEERFQAYTYTTEKHPEKQTTTTESYLKLAEDDCFTSLIISLKDVYDSKSLSLEGKYPMRGEIEEDIEDRIGFKVAETDQVQAQHLTQPFKIYKYGKYKLGGFQFMDSLDVGQVVPGTTDIKTNIKPSVWFMNDIYTNNWYEDFIIYNPTFYLEIPNYLTMKEETYQLVGYEGKKPRITRLKGKSSNTYIMKIQYYGEPESETGLVYIPRINSSSFMIRLEQSFTLIAEKYAPRGNNKAEIKMYSDFSNTFDYHFKNYQSKGEYYTDQNITIEEIQEEGVTVPVTVSTPSEIRMNILKSGEKIFDARVQDNSGGLSTELSMKDGETYNTYLNIINNSSQMDDFTMYIPVPRKNRSDDGGSYQWDAALKDVAASITAGSVSIAFSTDPNPTKNKLNNGGSDPDGMYVPENQISDLSQVTMIRISANSIPSDVTLSLNSSLESLTEKQKTGTQINKIYGYYSYRNSGFTSYTSGQTNPITANLTDVTVKGSIWTDSDKDGRFDEDEELLKTGQGEKFLIAIEKKDGSYQDVASSEDGTYSFEVASLKYCTGIRITMPQSLSDYPATYYRKSDVENNRQSYFTEREGMKSQVKFAENIPENLEHLNLGLIQAQRIVLDSEEYMIRKGKTKTITHTLEPADPLQTIQYISMDPSIATVDSNGVVTAVAQGETQVELSFEIINGIRVKEVVVIRVVSNDAPIIHAEDVELNLGDTWDPLDPGRISVTDDHDTDISLDQIEVINSVPVKSANKSIFDLFKTDLAGKTTTVGTYEVIYSCTDSDGNRAEKRIRVKVHGLPVFKDLTGKEYDIEQMPPYYERLDNSLDPYQDIKVYWEEASDKINGKPQERLIDPTDNTTGSLSLINTVDSEGKPVKGIEKAGKYNGDYEAVTPKGGSLTMNRTVYIRGKVNLTGNNIAVPASAKQISFADLDEFLKVYGKQLDLKASVDTPEKDGSIRFLDLSDKITSITDISKLDFSLKEGQDTKTMELMLKVTDQAENYKDKTVTLTLYLTVQDVVGNAPNIEFPTSSLDRIENDKVAALGGIYQELLDFASIYDFDVDGKPMAQGRGIKERGIKAIYKVNPKDMSNQDEIDVKDEAALEQMLKTIGIYRMVYFAIDDDNNYVQAEWIVHVAGRTYFVKNIADGAPADSVLNLRQRKSGNYSPTGVLAYHIDSDGMTRHESPVLVLQGTKVDWTKIGATEVTFSSAHHFQYYPGTTNLRPQDEFVQNILVHGPITFDGATAKEDYFVDETVKLDTVTAGFMQAFSNKKPEMTAIEVTSDKGKTLVSDTAKKETIIYQAKDTVTHSDAGNTEVLEKEIWFYGLPTITAPDSVTVKQNSTEEELKGFIQASAEIDLPDETGHDLTDEISYDFSKVDLSGAGGNAELSVTYRLPDKKERTVVHTVTLVVSQPPVITGNDIEKNEGEPLDLLKDAGVTVNDDFDNIDLSSIQVIGNIPVNKEGLAEGPGTYQITLQAVDSQGGKASKDILIRVHGLPVIHGAPDLEARVGDSFQIWDGVSVTWMEAPAILGAAVEKTFYYGSAVDEGSIELTNYRRINADQSETPVDISALNVPGFYKGDYVAVTPKGGTSTETHTLLLHGNPSLSVESISLSVNYTKPEKDAEKQFLKDYQDSLMISSEVVHALNDGTTEKVDLLKKGKVSIDLSKVKFGEKGSYPAVVTATDDLINGVASKSVERSIMINIEDFDGEPPAVTTHHIQRVSTDSVKEPDDVMTYLLSSTFLEIVKGDYDISRTEIKSIRQIEGPDLSETTKGKAVPEDIDRNGDGVYDNQELMQMMQSVGNYEITYLVTDVRSNTVEAVAQVNVAGPTEFGFGSTDADFQKLGDIIERRQARGEIFTVSGIRARHQDPNGSYHYMAVELSDPKADISLENVSVKNLAVESVHHYTTYEDGSKRPKDTKSFKLLVQGEIQFKAFSDLTTFVGSVPAEDYQVEAFYQRIDQDGNITEEQAVISVDVAAVTDTRGSVQAVLRATDDKTNAPGNSITKVRTIHVNGMPTATFNDSISVSKGASEEEVLRMLDVSASYRNYLDEVVEITGTDLEINVSGVDTGVPGKYHEANIKVWYEEYDGTRKSVDYVGQVYVLNDPSAVVMIPANINLKDLDETYAGAKEEITLYTDGDAQPEKIPAVEIYPDSKVILKAEKESYEAFTYYEDGTKYTSAQVPIMTLKYGNPGEEKGVLLIKTEIDRTKPVSTYLGTMNFTIKYGGGQS
ncbi:MAG: Ig-like domain-containing protein [Faecalicatena sp.]|uniref:Ig-like domain-containing protein n=1 Tax=Faecalicatena sp. TaxID=2005360 RepID=UPI00258C5DFB|nr:Ig-like domain-containing protein [Faecalicatena sp.]MCI6467559.1 Ig-like domain-containing protein [Faecalicatena sp.]MDY5619736.1 Ig-like domain-containing protein [Lachnospiraceae bacterium]